MRLKQIKLAGFKSFVDATKIPFINALTAIIGPNGCGKSNVIDAVRWVLGESSAKHLRGDSMMDVIFNGSSARRPVSLASVELLFENNHGRLGGEFASYSEISVKRQVSRDGDSNYFLNGQKCRRKDITELFMGTGLGARSYAIIGQGTISRLIESKPQELRVFIEEAAGISRYKERRRDTENRIRHTRENLERLGDIRLELTSQLEKLAEQAKAAKKYRALKQDERNLHVELLAVRYQGLMAQLDNVVKEINQQQLAQAKAQTAYEKEELSLTALQAKLTHLGDDEHIERSAYYEANTQIASLEEKLLSAELRQKQAQTVLVELQEKLSRLNREIADNQAQAEQLDEQSQALEYELETQTHALQLSENTYQEQQRSLNESQLQMQSHSKQTLERKHALSLLSSELGHLQQQEAKLAAQLEQDKQVLTDAAHIEADAEIARLTELQQQLAYDIEIEDERLASVEDELILAKGQLADNNDSLQQALQQHSALEARAQVLDELLTSYSQDSDKLWQYLDIEKGWEQASSLVLGSAIHFPIADSDNSVGFVKQSEIAKTSEQQGTAGDSPAVGPVSSSINIAPWLKGVHWAENIEAGKAQLSKLKLDERVATADGYLLGHGFTLTLSGDEPSLLAFNEERLSLTQDLINIQQNISALQQSQTQYQEAYNQALALSDTIKRQLVERNTELLTLGQNIANKQQQIAHAEQQRQEASKRLSALADELTLLGEKKVEREAELAIQQQGYQQAQLDEEEWHQAIEKAKAVLDSAGRDYEAKRQAVADIKQQQIPFTTQIALNGQAYTQLKQSLKECEKQQGKLLSQREQVAHGDEPSHNELKLKLEQQLELRQIKQQKLDEIHAEQVTLQEQVDTLAISRKQQLANINQLEASCSELKLRREGLKGQADSQRLALQEEGVSSDLLADTGLSAKSEQQRQAELDKIRRSIARLGAINLAAIDEYEQQSERKRYLDEQDEDLNKALASLEDAIRKIDRETRSRFKQTFEQVNHDLGQLFPKVFGGGSAYLAMTDDDLLDTGVTIMARPPGKKNSTIHLLSGGEKALTALSLVFAIFRLNPAPFCMLDEVDAPLDDANVERFCRLLQEMSQSVQFIYISHNKITMEMADQLIGVTMHEPGVSRIVAVDIDEAVALADAG